MVRLNNYEEYIKAGKWKCSDSPTGAHHSHEVSREGQFGYFLCKYCFGVQKLPITLDSALKMSGRSFKDTSIIPKLDNTYTYKTKGGRHGRKVSKNV